MGTTPANKLAAGQFHARSADGRYLFIPRLQRVGALNMLAFQEGKTAGQEGTNHDANPYTYFSQEGHAWGNGWLVGNAPQMWGDLEDRYTETEKH